MRLTAKTFWERLEEVAFVSLEATSVQSLCFYDKPTAHVSDRPGVKTTN